MLSNKRLRLISLFVASSIFCVVNSASLTINCTSEGLLDTECGYHILKTINAFINMDKSYSSNLPPVTSALDLPVVVNASLGLNHISHVDMLEGTVQVSWKHLHIKWRTDMVVISCSLLWTHRYLLCSIWHGKIP